MSGSTTALSDPETDPETIDTDDTCPWCRGHVMPGDEFFDGSEFRCCDCGRWVVAVEYTDVMAFIRLERMPTDVRTGRQRTRARWRKQGRR